MRRDFILIKIGPYHYFLQIKILLPNVNQVLLLFGVMFLWHLCVFSHKNE